MFPLFSASVVDTSGAPWFAIISAIFEKIRNDPNAFTVGAQSIAHGHIGDVIWQKKKIRKIFFTNDNVNPMKQKILWYKMGVLDF